MQAYLQSFNVPGYHIDAMATEVVNPILPEFLDKLDPEFVELYNRYQGQAEPSISKAQTDDWHSTTTASPSSLHRRISIQFQQVHLSDHTGTLPRGSEDRSVQHQSRSASRRDQSQSIHTVRRSHSERRSQDFSRTSSTRKLPWRFAYPKLNPLPTIPANAVLNRRLGNRLPRLRRILVSYRCSRCRHARCRRRLPPRSRVSIPNPDLGLLGSIEMGLRQRLQTRGRYFQSLHRRPLSGRASSSSTGPSGTR